MIRRRLIFKVLAARVSTVGKSNSQLRGTIVVNGQRRVESKFRKISAYVLQVFIVRKENFMCKNNFHLL